MAQSETVPTATAATVAPQAPPTLPPKKPRKSGCGCMLPLLVLGLLIAFAPRIISQTALRNQVPALLMSKLPPGVEIGSASVGWSTPIALNDVVIPDDQGRPALRAKHVTLSVSLWELARGTQDFGTITIEQPTLELIVEQGVTNYDRFLGRLSTGPGGGDLPKFDVQLRDAEITLRQEPLLDTKTSVEAERLPPIAVIQIPKAGLQSQSGKHDLAGQLTALLKQPRVEQPVTAEITWDLPQKGVAGIGSGQLKADVPSLPLEVLAPWIEPYTSGRAVSGEIAMSAAIEVVPSDEGQLLIGAGVKLPRLDVRLSGQRNLDGTMVQPYHWRGENLELIAEGAGDLAGQRAVFEAIRLRTPVVSADFAGTVADLPGEMVCDLTGTSNIQLTELLALIPSEHAQHIRVEGLQCGEIRIQGPLRSARTEVANSLQVSTDVQWTAADFYGFQSDNALVTVHYLGDAVEINPNRLPLGGGQWVAAPRIEFGGAGNALVFAGGPILEGVGFTPEMSQTWLKYVSPLLGSTTSIEGRFSLSADPARVLLAPPYAGRFSGILAIESAKAGAGPMTQQILDSVGTVQRLLGRKAVAANEWITVDQQNVPFSYADGRVTHKDLRAGIGELTVTSSGSVGIDETIDFQLDMPLPDKWTENRPLLANMKGESIVFQMTGTLDQPQLDSRSLSQFSQQIGVKGAAGLLDGLLKRRQEKSGNGTILPAPRRNR